MLSLRALGRIAPRSVLRPASNRCLSYLSKSPFLRPSWQSIKKSSYPAFSTSIARREPAGESDQELSAKIEHERLMESEASRSGEMPQSVSEFLENGPWKLEDNPGTHTVVLRKEFGNEQIKVEFTINDLMEMPEEDEDGVSEDQAFGDEEVDDEPKRTINQSGVKGDMVDVVPEDSVSPADRGESADSETPLIPEYPISLQITITKPGNKVMNFIAQYEEGLVTVEHVSHGKPEDEKHIKYGYDGPQMASLDPDLRSLLEQYVEERGINAELGAFAGAYIDYKEQKEYMNWLTTMRDFVDT